MAARTPARNGAAAGKPAAPPQDDPFGPEAPEVTPAADALAELDAQLAGGDQAPDIPTAAPEATPDPEAPEFTAHPGGAELDKAIEALVAGPTFDPRPYMMQLKGKDYLPVAGRLVWFRGQAPQGPRPEWGIETAFEILDLDAGVAMARATIRDEHGRIRATATKLETRKGFPDFTEKAETGSIGRALALLGYGTQFAPELDEGEERIVDSPQAPRGSSRQAPPADDLALPGERQAAPAASTPPASDRRTAARGGEAPAAPAPAAGGEQAPHLCAESGCGAELTEGQYTYSVKTYGRGLCPTHQRAEARKQRAAGGGGPVVRRQGGGLVAGMRGGPRR
jgi:hypothetical protein